MAASQSSLSLQMFHDGILIDVRLPSSPHCRQTLRAAGTHEGPTDCPHTGPARSNVHPMVRPMQGAHVAVAPGDDEAMQMTTQDARWLNGVRLLPSPFLAIGHVGKDMLPVPA